MIDEGADVNAGNKCGSKSFRLALKRGHAEAAVAVIDKGADVNAGSKYGGESFRLALKRGHAEAANGSDR